MGQVTIFIIIVILLVAGIGLFFVFRDRIIGGEVPRELEPVYSYYQSCIEEETLNGVAILGQQGGYIEIPEFEPGSEYMPFSSQLNFLGIGVPYWYYVSGNGIFKEQIPSKQKMQSQLDGFLDERLNACDFSEFYEQGFEIEFGEAEVSSKINENSIILDVNQDLNLTFGDITFSKNSHTKTINSNLGKFYDLANKIYSNQKENLFLERYGLDILRLYAPVDGSEIGCAPKLWFVEDIKENLTSALETNVPMTKVKGDYYTLSEERNKYFVQDLGSDVDTNVNFMYSREWPMRLEVWPAEDNILRADPVGLQEGLGMLGFCYTPYHFVYDLSYPVLIQMYSGNEMFQFPVVVVIDKNQLRAAQDVEGLPDVVPELCLNKNSKTSVYVYNINLEPVKADIKYKCFDTACYIGETEYKNGEEVLEAEFPQCSNGVIIASAEGYETNKYLFSTVNEGSASIILDKLYKLDLSVQKNYEELNGEYAIITFESDNKTKTVSYPEQEQVELTEGQYSVKAYIYSNSSINVQGSSSQKCVDVPKSGLLGTFGMTEKKCFTLDIPDQVVSYAISGGGNENYYISESELIDSKKLTINSNNFESPKTVEQLQLNYNNIEISGLDIIFE